MGCWVSCAAGHRDQRARRPPLQSAIPGQRWCASQPDQPGAGSKAALEERPGLTATVHVLAQQSHRQLDGESIVQGYPCLQTVAYLGGMHRLRQLCSASLYIASAVSGRDRSHTHEYGGIVVVGVGMGGGDLREVRGGGVRDSSKG